MRPALFALAAALALNASVVMAAKMTYSATLNAASEVPPKESDGTGIVQVEYDTDSKVMNYTVNYSGLTGPATAAHFHGPAAVGVNAPPVVPLKGALVSPIEGSATLTDEQAKELQGGQMYFNIHTAANPGGEIRGQLQELGK
ncbi:CHRD domain-containing protein [Silvimonas iriomotensis]|uniref:CHRD domain-containing protein n=1 Tax=Silvimonas iriomotensis TaxID=449662 RepID=A0ABQ2PFX5_9NEIS|nr:CHRD domain-containing protein [Silvimonas iriomotensis]GGP24142.1 CHRD domain-containing protein [Silvimonas iriomotensis]